MNMSQEIMNMSFASSQNSHVYGLQQNIQREYHDISPDRKHVLINNKRHVRIRNPRYVTPGVARPHKSPVRHHNRNHQHMPTTLLEPMDCNASPSAFSATPRRGPWRYMEVNDQWITPNGIAPNNLLEHQNTEDILSDEFDDCGLEIDRDVNRVCRNTLRNTYQSPHNSIEGLRVSKYKKSSSPYSLSSSSKCFQKRQSQLSQQQMDTHQVLRSPSASNHKSRILCSPKNIDIYSSDDIIEELDRSPKTRYSPQRVAFNRDSNRENACLRKSVIGDIEIGTKGMKLYKCEPRKQTASPNTFFVSPTKTSSHSPSKQQFRTLEFPLKGKSSSLNHSLMGVDDARNTPSSPFRNSTPVHHRPRALFQGEHSDKNLPEMSVNGITPVTKSSRTNKPLSLSYQDPPVYPYRAKSRERTLMSVGRIDKALEYHTPRNEVVHTCETDKERPNHTNSSINHPSFQNQNSSQPDGHDESVLSIQSKISAKRKPTGPKMSKELALLIASNDYYGICTEQEIFNKENEPMKTRRLRLESPQQQSHETSSFTKGLKATKYLSNESRNSTSTKKIALSQCKTTQNNKNERLNFLSCSNIVDISNDTAFKMPLPPKSRKIRNTVFNKENKFSQKNKEDLYRHTAEAHDKEISNNELSLKNWTPKLKGKKLLIEGDLIDHNGIANTARYRTSKIVERLAKNLVKTTKRQYALVGKLSLQDAKKYETPHFILDSFAAGIPEKWEIYRDQWRTFVKEQRQMLFGSGASVSSWSNASSIGQASGFLHSTRTGDFFEPNHSDVKTRENIADINNSKSLHDEKTSSSRIYEKKLGKYSWEYLQEGKEPILSEDDSIVSTKDQDEISNADSSRKEQHAPNNARKQSIGKTSEEDIDDKLNHSMDKKPRERKKNRNYPSSKEANSPNEGTKYRHSVVGNKNGKDASNQITTSPKSLKEFYIIEVTRRKRQTRKVGKCLACSMSYSIPYIERHIATKHSSLLLDTEDNDFSECKALNRGLDVDIQPTVVLTRMNSEKNAKLDRDSRTSSKNVRNRTKISKNAKTRMEAPISKKNTSSKEIVKLNDASGDNKTRNNKLLEKQDNAIRTFSYEKASKKPLAYNKNLGPHSAIECKKQTKKSKHQSDTKTKRENKGTDRNMMMNRSIIENTEGSKIQPGHTFRSHVTGSDDNMKNIVVKPKTIKDIQSNTRVLQAFNRNHKDDIFMNSKARNRKIVKETKQGPKDIVADLFDSDSENDLSLHSARTPIGRYFERTESKTPANSQESNPEDDAYFTLGKKEEFQQDAFINRKVKETRKRSRLTKAFNSNSSNILQSFTKPPRNATEKQSQELVKPISNLLNQEDEEHDDNDEDAESYFSEEPSTFTRSVADPPMGLLDLYEKEKSGNRQISSIRRNY